MYLIEAIYIITIYNDIFCQKTKKSGKSSKFFVIFFSFAISKNYLVKISAEIKFCTSIYKLYQECPKHIFSLKKPPNNDSFYS